MPDHVLKLTTDADTFPGPGDDNSGDDTVKGLAGNDILNGGAGNDKLVGGGGDDTLSGGDGIDNLKGGGGADNLSGNDGNDKLNGGGGNDTLNGGNGDDVLKGKAGDDVINGGEGNDTLEGHKGTDTLDGGEGSDTYKVHAKEDSTDIYADSGTDGGTDILDATRVDDLFLIAAFDAASSGIEVIEGDGTRIVGGEDAVDWDFTDITLSGIKQLRGTTDDDSIVGSDGDDKIIGRGGNDTLDGGAGDDVVKGGGGDDTLRGDQGNDKLKGGGGDDVLIFDSADTSLVNGGSGSDTLALNSGENLDITNSAGSVYKNIEIIDLGGTGDNSLTLDGASVLAFSKSTDTLRVLGGVGDAVISSSTAWIQGEPDTIDNVLFNQYSFNEAVLLVQDGVDQSLITIGVNAAPTIATNTGLTLAAGASASITTSVLDEGGPDDNGAGLTYTITALPGNGSILLNGAPLSLNGTFTQADIDNNLISYSHDGSNTSSDSFGFSLADGGENGVNPVTGTFAITVETANEPQSFSTSFETEPAGTINLGTSPVTATLTGGNAMVVGIGAYYNTGSHSWHVEPGVTAIISFESPASEVSLFFRDTSGAGPSEVRVFDVNNNLISTTTGTQSFQQVEEIRTGNQTLIDRIEIEQISGGGGGGIVVDDVSFTATATGAPASSAEVPGGVGSEDPTIGGGVAIIPFPSAGQVRVRRQVLKERIRLCLLPPLGQIMWIRLVNSHQRSTASGWRKLFFQHSPPPPAIHFWRWSSRRMPAARQRKQMTG